jgi:CheY-like chemotaxis protein/HPt (histidine-containing phosphotransfer) domain-containing protein
MGGEIGLISEPGAGSTFSVRLTLPLSDAVHAQTPGDSVRVQPCHILVVDDVQLNCELARSFLEKAGHLVDVSLDGQDALRKCNATRYDLILMDVQMPVFDGLMATRALRDSRCASSGTPVIALTAGAMPDQIKKCLAAGMNGHVAKPILEGDLTAAVVKWAAPGSRAVSSTTAPPLKFDGFQAMYLDQLRSDSDALRGAIQNERPYREIAGLIHQIAGSAGSFGFSGISEAALAMDAQFEQGQTPQASDVDVLLELMDSALAQFEPTQKESAPH